MNYPFETPTQIKLGLYTAKFSRMKAREKLIALAQHLSLPTDVLVAWMVTRGPWVDTFSPQL
jgi:hypothetical protein